MHPRFILNRGVSDSALELRPRVKDMERDFLEHFLQEHLCIEVYADETASELRDALEANIDDDTTTLAAVHVAYRRWAA